MKSKFSSGVGPLLVVLLLGLLLRVFLAPFGTLTLDQNTFIAWSNILVERGFAHFYETWSDYLPGYLYVLWFLGKVKGLLPIPEVLLYKLPAIFADVATGAIVYFSVWKFNKKLAPMAAAIYLFNPAVIANSTLWGQIDGITAFFALASLFFATSRPALGAIALGLGALTKVQAGFVAPIVAFLWVKKLGMSRTIAFSLLSLIVFLLGFIPFSADKPFLPFVFERLGVTANQYPYTSVNAFNFWAISGGWWKTDAATFVSPLLVGILLFLLFILVSLAILLRKGERKIYLVAAFLFLASFLFLTRVHERHLLPAFAPLSVAAAANPILFLPYITFSLTYLANLYFSYMWINENFRMVFSPNFINLAILANLASLGIIVFSFIKEKPLEIKTKIRKFKTELSEIPFLEKNAKVILGVILVFALISRLFGLSFPRTFYFDEVYHAFTAREMLRGNPAAWEWWNTPPEGFAYEWSHPPLAKLAMVAGMWVLGENPLGWRLPGVLVGVASVLLIYLIGLSLFGNQTLALLSSAIFTLEGLPLVMSRLGMNDTYFLFFALLTIYFFLKEKIFWSAASLGLALSAKWTAFWLVPVLLLGFFLFRRKLKFVYLSFLVLPPLIYLASYLPFFFGGHTLSQFIELQKQMWWYHTGLQASHPFQSSWWTWPLDLRPVWLFTEAKDDFVANIYAMGNPLIFWLGLAAVVAVGVRGILERNRSLLFVVLAYVGLFLPWALSPRIMFLYHYLPALPFLSLATGWVLLTQKKAFILYFFIALLLYLLFYPHWTGISVPRWLDDLYYWLPNWR